jgi:alpha-galactosidase
VPTSLLTDASGSKLLTVTEGALSVVIEVTSTGDVRLLHCAALPFDSSHLPDSERRQIFRLVEIHLAGEDVDAHHDSEHIAALPGRRLRYLQHDDYPSKHGHTLLIEQYDPLTAVRVSSYLRFFTDLPVMQTWTSVANAGTSPVTLDYVSSFALTGLAKEGLRKWDEKMRLGIAHNSWCSEAQWHISTLPELGLQRISTPIGGSLKRLTICSIGTWSTAQHLPMGWVENSETNTMLAWQIEHNGAWHWEIGEQEHQLYLRVGGPTEQESQWWQTVAPGDSFTTIPVAVCVSKQVHEHPWANLPPLDHLMGALTSYRRAIRRPNQDNTALPVIFNDFMNCLRGEPTATKELPLIARAARAGCEIYCIDAGWYADGSWWDSVGEWQPSRARFPEGLTTVLDTIRQHGMVPGLWLELEVMGVHAPGADQLPDTWFFCRHGKRVVDHGRYQLDFRSPEVRAYADAVIDRLINEYGVGYIKMDYNINAGVGTSTLEDSAGAGLLGHNRAYLDWLDNLFVRYPDLIIENCASGGMRMDYAMLQRHSLQSVSDQEDYRLTSVIAAAMPTAVNPEQAGVWSYPLKEADAEAVACNMVNALLGRVLLSGQLVDLDEQQFALVTIGIAYYKRIRALLPRCTPLWPLGLPTFAASWCCLGLLSLTDRKLFLAIWRRESAVEECTLSLPYLAGRSTTIVCAYPDFANTTIPTWNEVSATLRVRLPQPFSARLYECSW